jgi:hypothetical protein
VLHDRETGVKLNNAAHTDPFPHSLGHKHAKCVAANSVLFNHFVGNRKEHRRNV